MGKWEPSETDIRRARVKFRGRHLAKLRRSQGPQSNTRPGAIAIKVIPSAGLPLEPNSDWLGVKD